VEQRTTRNAGDLDARLTRLEAEVRRWRLTALVVPAALVALWLAGTARPSAGARGLDLPPGRPVVGPAEVAATRFVLRDASGTPRAVLGVAPDGEPMLSFLDRAGDTRAALAPGHLALTGDDGVSAARLLISPGGTPALRLEKDGRLRAVLGMTGDGILALGLYGQDGSGRALLDVAADGAPGLTLFHRGGKVAWSAP
jgi:hypothetical protein